tara:strand:+ start:321 stop:464 length:144 start_codon:yes stop_codon:yes gene_type:complete
MYTKEQILSKTIELYKDYAIGGGDLNPDAAMHLIHEQLTKLNDLTAQ